MINNICDSNKSATKITQTATTTTNVALKAASSSNAIVAAVKDDDGTTQDNVILERMANGLVQTTYGNGIWYSEIIDKVSKVNTTKIANVNSNCNINSTTTNNNNRTNVVNRNVWLSNRIDILKEHKQQKQQEQQQQQQNYTSNNSHTNNNECDIIIVDMENDNDDDDCDVDDKSSVEEKHTITTSTFYLDSNMKFYRKPPRPPPPPPPTLSASTNLCDNNRSKPITNEGNIIRSKTDVIYHDNDDNNTHVKLFNKDNNVVHNDAHDNDDEDDVDDDSLASMETLSDNVSIWIDGEKHWVSGVDATTTCADLIWALLNYQNGQQHKQELQQQQHVFAIAVPSTNEHSITEAVMNKTNSNRQQQQQQPKQYDKNDIDLNFRSITNQCNISTLSSGNKPNSNQININTNITNINSNNSTTTTTTTINNCSNGSSTSNQTTIAINQSMPISTKENCKIIPNSMLAPLLTASSTSAATIPTLTPTPTAAPAPLPLPLPPGIRTVSQLATEYVIVRQYHHCEEYLDGSTKVFDVLPPHDGPSSHRKECELLLRYLGPAPATYANNTATPQLSSLISTDKDSGMGSPVGSARSAKFRRRKHKSSQWLAQANTLHPKLSRCTANERLMRIILAQDETIQRQLSLLREKERQITKIEEEKHRKRERELGKNYLLETYLNGLDEADCEPEAQNGEEIFIDEPYRRQANTTTIPGTAVTPKIITAIEETVAGTTAADAFSVMARHKHKEKEAKKEKKHKRHKEKTTTTATIEITKDERLLHSTKEFNGITNKSRDKEKLDQQQQQQDEQHCELKGNTKDTATSNEQEIEMQILWLEKIYTLNKQLQKEEELAAKLHAKVRKHQLRKAQQTQREVQMEIDKLDNNLALQCGDIRKVEANLMQTNDQLQKKLLILERLSFDYLQQQQEEHKQQDDIKEIHKNEMLTKEREKKENPLKNENNIVVLTNLEKSLDIQKLSLNNIKSKEEAKKLEKIIAKPSIELSEETKPKAAANNHIHNSNAVSNSFTAFKMPHNHLLSNEYTNRLNEIRANTINDTSNTSNCNAIVATANNQQQTLTKPQLLTPLTTAGVPTSASEMATNNTSLAGTATAAATTKTETLSASSMFIDKNMLSSLHVQNAKTIRKQMFHTQTTAQQYKQPATAASAFPKQQFQHMIPQQQQQQIIAASTFLTSRPQNSHQISTPISPSLATSSNIVFLQHPTALTAIATPPSASSSTLCESSALIAVASPPPLSTSPSPSIMAMNTVDISQLGTLV